MAWDLHVLAGQATLDQLKDPDMPLAVCADLSPADWIVASDLPGPRLVTFGPGGDAPAFVWPPDRTWCVAADIDPCWPAIGASAPLIERLTSDPGLDAVEANPAHEPPAYR